MARIRTTEISGTECIGDSLIRINENFEALDTLTDALTSFSSSVSAFIDEQTPTPPILSLVAGNGILIDGGDESLPNNQNVSVAAYDSIIHIPNTVTTLVNQANSLTYTLADGTAPRFTRIPYVTTEFKPGFTFETTSLGKIPPSLTLYWLTSAGRTSSTAYATNSASTQINTTTWYPNNADKIGSDTAQVRAAKFINDRTLLIGGNFSKMGAILHANAPTNGTLRGGFGVIDLLGGTLSTNGLGYNGALSSIPVTTGTTGERILNASSGTAPGNSTINGFRNGTVYAIEQFRVTSNNSEWYAVAGTFTQANPIADVSVDRLVLIHKNNSTTACKEYPLIVTGNPVSLLYADGYLYVTGSVAKVRAPYANWGTNVVNTDLTVYGGTFRIDMTGTTPRIDTAFITNTASLDKANLVGVGYTLGYYDGILYVGGKTIVGGTRHGPKKNIPASRCFVALYTQPTGTGRTPSDRSPGHVVKDWSISVNNYHASYYNGIRSITIDSTTKMMYVAGDPASIVRRAPESNDATATTFPARGVMAFDITNPAYPIYKQNWIPSALPLNYRNGVISTALHKPGDDDSSIYVMATPNLLYCFSNPNAGGNPNATAGLLQSWKATVNAAVPWNEIYPDALIRIPETSPLSGILITGDFTVTNNVTRYNVARINGINEGLSTPASAVCFNVQGSLITEGAPLDSSTSLFTLTAEIGEPFELRRTITPALTSIFGEETTRKQLMRFTVTRPGDDGVLIDPDTGTETPFNDSHRSDIWLYGCALDYNE